MVERLEPIAEAFKRLLVRLLGHPPMLDSMEGLIEAQASVNLLVDSALPKAAMVLGVPPDRSRPGQVVATASPATQSRNKPPKPIR